MLGLNFEFMYGKWSSARPWPKVSAAQTRAFEKIKENCNYWCKRALKVADCPKPETILKTRKLITVEMGLARHCRSSRLSWSQACQNPKQ